ncbi:hypothetical protein BUALT_Bualt11G0132900 [Buddleja alternifolia]|uniref:Kinetochore protein Spc24 n=1 Tax=Buddleja alternifolia TaxID=168488 RepID=A0AAV6X3C9_9LAMI|nr:hypothetical protein BUALT_Bualt11G0132900 [Buddleja alternifolia]
MKTIHIEELMTYSDSLIEFLKEDKDIVGLKHFLHQSTALQSQRYKDFNEVQNSIEECVKKIDACKQKAAAAETESAPDADLNFLQKELEDEQLLEHQRDFIEEQRQTFKKLEQDELRAQMKLSMYASVTNIIPHLDDTSKISGHIVEMDKKEIEKFEFDPSNATAFYTCNNIWKMIKS